MPITALKTIYLLGCLRERYSLELVVVGFFGSSELLAILMGPVEGSRSLSSRTFFKKNLGGVLSIYQ